MLKNDWFTNYGKFYIDMIYIITKNDDSIFIIYRRSTTQSVSLDKISGQLGNSRC